MNITPGSLGRIAVMGTGGTGSCIGAALIEAGHDVWLIDQWPAHVEAMKANGLRISMPGPGNDRDHPVESSVPVQAMHLCDVCTLKFQFDLVFLACKSYDSRWMVELIKPYLKENGVLVGTQNGLNDEWIAPMIGYHRDIACAFELSSVVVEPGFVRRNNDRSATHFYVGELHGQVTTRLQAIAQLLSSVGRTVATSNIWGAKWSKLIVNSMGMPLAAISGVRTAELYTNPGCLNLAVSLGKESLAVSRALGVVLEPLLGSSADDLATAGDLELQNMLHRLTADIGRRTRNSALQDVMKGRRLEIDYLNGAVVAKGRYARVPTPLNELAVSLAKQVERGELQPAVSNLVPMLERYEATHASGG